MSLAVCSVSQINSNQKLKSNNTVVCSVMTNNLTLM